MSFRRYERYKDSGVEWLGEVPAHWSVRRLRFAAWLNPSKNETASIPRDTDVSFLPMESIGDDGSLDLSRIRPIANVESGYTYFREDDVTVAKITPCFENGKGAVMRDLRNGIGFGTTELIVARPIDDVLTSDWLHLIFTSQPFRRLGEAAMYGAGGQKRVPDDFVRDFAIALPSVAEQTAIAAFLDRETAKIDALVAEQQVLIGLLKEKRQAVISHAVTKGLDPNVPMKDSGVEWLGEVPAHWSIGALGYLASVDSGATPDRSREDFWGGSIPWVKTGEIDYTSIQETEEHITESALTASSTRVAPAGTLLMAMYGQGSTRGRVAILGLPATYNQACAAITFSDRVDVRFGRYFFVAAYDFIRDAGNEASQMNLGTGIIRKFKLTVPPLDYQERIVEALDQEVGKFELMVVEAERAVELLRERRSALISAAVTGQIDVRAMTAPSPMPTCPASA